MEEILDKKLEILDKVNGMKLSETLGAILHYEFTDAESKDVAESYRNHLLQCFDHIHDFLRFEVEGEVE